MYFLDKFAEVTKKYPDRTALVDMEGTRATTYYNLDRLSDRIANTLRQRGAQKGDAVIIMLGRRMEYIAAEIAILKICCVVVPLNTDYPEDRVAYIAKDCKAAFTIDADFIDAISEQYEYESEKQESEDKVMIIYTSGSTGKPKGVVYTEAAYDSAVKTLSTLCEGIPEIRYGAAAPLSFIVRLIEYISNLCVGGTIHIISEKARRDIALLESYYAKNRLTCGFISPRMLAIFRNSGNELKRVFTGSERVANMYSDDFQIVNIYGQTEAVPMLSFTIDKPYENTPIGRPFPGTEVKLIDENDNEVCEGGDGEICLIGVFPHEYLNLPEESKKHFECLSDGRVIVHTGDIGTRLEDGSYKYLNRKDWMVKINGQRVEPGEIEAVIKRIPRVLNAAVKEFTTPNGHIYLCGYYVSDKIMEPHEVNFYLKKELPDYMIPERYRQLEKLPLNINGKLDRSKLPEPEKENFAQNLVMPVTEAEKFICEKVSQILKCGKIGIEEDFFLLGGDSVNAAKLALEISEHGFGNVGASDIYRFPIIRDLAQFANKGQIGSEDIFCFSKGQEGITPLFFVHPANTGCESYRDIAASLDPKIPFYGLDNHNINYPDLQIRTIKRIAWAYITFMRDICPKGPYRLGGWSYGGVVAFEMALQLQAAGETVEDLILLDPMIVPDDKKEEALESAFDPNLIKYFEEETLFDDIRKKNGADYLFENNKNALKDIAMYTPETSFHSKVLYFNAGIIRNSDYLKKLSYKEYANGFGKYCDRITVEDIDCNHDELGLNSKVVKIIKKRIEKPQQA